MRRHVTLPLTLEGWIPARGPARDWLADLPLAALLVAVIVALGEAILWIAGVR